MNVSPTVGVSVVVSTRNRPDVLARLLKAIDSAAVLPEEVVVVDQSADDATETVVHEYPEGPLSIVYVRDRRSGLGIAQNAGFALATCGIVAVTDDDCVPGDQWLSSIVSALTADSGLAGITGPVLPLQEEGRVDLFPISSRTSRTTRTFSRRSSPWTVGSGNNFAFRLDWLRMVGGNDERLGPGSTGQGGVDMDLFYRLLRADATIRYEPAAVVYHAMTTREQRLARRGPYGYGMGAAIGIWMRERDRNAPTLLVRWIWLRLRRIGRGLLTLDRLRLREEWLILVGTARGLVHGWRIGPRPNRATILPAPRDT